MDSGPLGLLATLLPAIPSVSWTALMHTLQATELSKYVDLKTELTVAFLRSVMSPSRPKSITAMQELINRDPGIKGRIWVSTYRSPDAPEAGARDAVIRAIEGLQKDGHPEESGAATIPSQVPVEAEWTGYRAGAGVDSTLPPLSEAQLYAEMMRECKSAVTVLYFHGGAYWLMDPASSRPTTKKLAKLTGGRCYSVRYRLAPQNPFPAAVIDALVSYLTLLYPPPGAFHDAVAPEHIVFSGDSAGGNLSLALTQTLLELRRQGARVSWFGAERDVPLPAGVAVNSPWLDMTHCLPSFRDNAAFDYLPSAASAAPSRRPSCPAWPASPPRTFLYADDRFLDHPLATLLLAPSWAGCPPVYVCSGWELLSDEARHGVARLHADGVPVVFEEYEAMAHCFALVFPHSPLGRRCMDGWAAFVRRAVETPAEAAGASRFVRIKAKTLEEEELDPTQLSPLTPDAARDMVSEAIQRLTKPQRAEEMAKL